MQQTLKTVLEVQELDMQMIQLMRLKKERLRELDHIHTVKADLSQKAMIKEGEIIELKKTIRIMEGEVSDLVEKRKKLENQQSQVKKVDEFNALNQEISQIEKERTAKEQRQSEFIDQVTAEEAILKTIQETLSSTTDSSKVLETEIKDAIIRINEEGREIKKKRDSMAEKIDPEVYSVYERLLKNKKDRVVVPLENRCCSGCHILLTPQHENLVRKEVKHLVFCEHCSRILYWQEGKVFEEVAGPKQRRRRRTADQKAAAE